MRSRPSLQRTWPPSSHTTINPLQDGDSDGGGDGNHGDGDGDGDGDGPTC